MRWFVANILLFLESKKIKKSKQPSFHRLRLFQKSRIQKPFIHEKKFALTPEEVVALWKLRSSDNDNNDPTFNLINI